MAWLLCFQMAFREGFEPPTDGLEGISSQNVVCFNLRKNLIDTPIFNHLLQGIYLSR
jgi:hypothetical protein